MFLHAASCARPEEADFHTVVTPTITLGNLLGVRRGEEYGGRTGTDGQWSESESTGAASSSPFPHSSPDPETSCVSGESWGMGDRGGDNDNSGNNTTAGGGECGISLTGTVGGAGASEAVPPAPPARDLAWLLQATAGKNRRIDWRSGLGFSSPVAPASDAELAWLREATPNELAEVSTRRRRAAIVGSMLHAWRGYRDHAWPLDELAPLSTSGIEWLGVGLTIVDALDTLLLMGLDEEADAARAWITSNALAFDADKNANVFESTIRVLGGLVAVHKLGGDTVAGGLLEKALDLAERLYPAFKTKTGIPIMDVNFQTGQPHQPAWTHMSSLSEAGTLVLEWEALEEALRQAENKTELEGYGDVRRSGGGRVGGRNHVGAEEGAYGEGNGERWNAGKTGVEEDFEYTFDEDGLTKVSKAGGMTGRSRLARSTSAALAGRAYRPDIAEGARRAFSAVTKAALEPEHDGILPSAVRAQDAKFATDAILTLGARGDSFYEYLLKHWLHSGKPAGGERAYLHAMDGVLLYMLHRSSGDGDAAFVAASPADSPQGSPPHPTSSSQGNAAAEQMDGSRGKNFIKKGPRRRWYSSSNDRRDDGPALGEGERDGSKSHLPAPPRGLLYVGEREGSVHGAAVHKMDHLVCFLPGLLALGYSEGLGKRWGVGNRVKEWQAIRALKRLGLPEAATHLDVARELLRTCVQMYMRTPTGLAPEITHFPLSGLAKRKGAGGQGLVPTGGGVSVFGDVLIKDKDSHNLLRPETVESLWVLWRVTGEQEWRDAGWRIWQAWEKHARVDTGGYASLKSVTVAKGGEGSNDNGFQRADKMESFFLAESLKYLYLLFSDDPALLPLPCFVFNTEAHPLPVLTRGASDGGACVERVVRQNIDNLAAQHGV